MGNTPQRSDELKKRILEDNVANITRSGKHYKPLFLETEPKGKEDKEE